MKKWVSFLVALIFYFFLHEGLHAVFASFFGEYQAFHIKPYGLEVTFNTSTSEREGFQWALISGMSNLTTILVGYLLLAFGRRIAQLSNLWLKSILYYMTFLFLLLDALNLSIGPFLYGGDVHGIARGLGVNHYVIQFIFFIVLLFNRELIAQKLMPMFNIRVENPVFKPWIRLPIK